MTELSERVSQMTPLKQALLKIEELQAELSKQKQKDAIAVIGMGCRFPSANNPEEFWKVLTEGIDTIGEVPRNRWDVDRYYDPTPNTPGKMITKNGGFLSNVDHFDAQFFGISPREAERIDPQQRLLLEVVWEALEDSGQVADRLAGSNTGVFVGISSNDYSMIQGGNVSLVDAYSGTGNAFSIAANRISYTFDFRGPSVAVDTACSSSLVAIHNALQSLRRGETDLAVAGGVNLILSPVLTITFSQAGMMSPDGRCKTFDASADGYGRGEGCGIVVLKRLADAQQDGDPILGVIYGSAVNQDGRSNGLTAPNGLSQTAVIRAAMDDAKIDETQIDYIEAHGTGTILGDPIEMGAIQKVLEHRSLEDPCYVGSVKTNIGHLESAAGVAGFIKILLALKYQQIPPHLHFAKINPYIQIDEIPVRIPTETVEWRAEKKRFAGISSFGFGGTNSHIILGDAPEMVSKDQGGFQVYSTKPAVDARPMHILSLSAKSNSSLHRLIEGYDRFVGEQIVNYDTQDQSSILADLCYLANTQRSHHEIRMAVTCESLPDLQAKLSSSRETGSELNSDPGRGIFVGDWTPKKKQKIAFLFTGQGSQYPLMGYQLYQTQPTFTSAVDECIQILQDLGLDAPLGVPLLDVIFSGDADAATQENSLLNETAYTQISLFVIEYALAQMWLSWGIKPDYLLGHSVGEYVAACISGVYSLEDGLRLIALRANLMQSLPSGGAMVVIFSPEEAVEEIIASYEGKVSIAAVNGPSNVVVSGAEEKIADVVEQCKQAGITTRSIKVSHAFHSQLMEPILDEFFKQASDVDYSTPKIPLVSNVTGQLFEAGVVPDASYWTSHIRNGVMFNAGMQALADERVKIFIETGPHPSLIGMGKRCIPDHQATWLASANKNGEAWSVLTSSLAQLYVSGHDVDWHKFDADYMINRSLTPSQLPKYPFDSERFWIDTDPAQLDELITDLVDGTASSISAKDGSELREDQVVAVVKDLFSQLNSDARISLLNSLGMVDGIESPVLKQRDEITSTIVEQNFSREKILAAQPEERASILESLLLFEIARVLKMPPDRLDVKRPVNYLGLDSIMAIELRNRIGNQLSIEIPISNLLQDSSIEQLASQLDNVLLAQQREMTQPHPIAVSSKPRGEKIGTYPLSYGQRAMWFQHQVAPDSIQNPLYAIRIKSELETSVIERITHILVKWHPSLRTTFEVQNGEPVQVIHEDLEDFYQFIDAQDMDHKQIQELITKETKRQYNLSKGPLFKVQIIHISDTNNILLFTAHHIVIDLWSIAIILNELLLLYRTALNTDTEIETIPSPHQYNYTDFVRWQTDYLASPEGKFGWEYWKSQLDGDLPVIEMPSDRPRPAIQTFNGQSHSFMLKDDLRIKLEHVTEKYGTTLYHVLLAAFNILVYRYTGQQDIVIGSPMTGRTQLEFTDVVGYFVNPIPIRSRINTSQGFHEFLAEVRMTVLDSIARQDYPFGLIVENIQPVRNLSHLPIFQLMFVYQKTNPEFDDRLLQLAWDIEGLEMNVAGLDMETVRVDHRTAPFDITFMLAESEDKVGASITYNTDLYTVETIERLWEHFRIILNRIAEDPTTNISEFNLIEGLERDHLIYQLNQTENYYRSDRCIHELFEEQVLRTPDAPALTFRDESLTYRELNQEANRLAHYLIAMGVKPETVVGICVDRSFDMIIGLLGVMKAGGAYLPIDPTLPVDRIAYLIHDADIPILLTQSAIADRLPTFACKVLYLDKNWEATAREYYLARNGRVPDKSSYKQNPRTAVSPANMAYVIYTSGSTGKSKGVMVPHSGLCNFIPAYTTAFGVDQTDKYLQFASFSFDASVAEIFMALTVGANLILAEKETLLSVPDTIELIQKESITTAILPPSLLSVLPEENLPTFRTVISAGESCFIEVAQKWANGRGFFNGYGPTECTIGPTYYHYVDQDILESQASSSYIDNLKTCPIGRPINNIRVYLLDKDMQPVPLGVPGEIYLSGVGVTRGYLRKPSLTAEKFLPDPFDTKVGGRLYKTGDLGRYLPDGNIEYIGRTDYQVKVRGYRIELGEIESVIMSHPSIVQSAVVVIGKELSDRKLAAFVMPENGRTIDVDRLRLFMRESLPEYMIPASFVIVDQLPLNTSGKVDRKKLPDIAVSIDTDRSTFIPPRSDMERKIAAVWQEMLVVSDIGLDDNFFDMGGHSLLMTKTHLRLQEELDRELSIVDLFGNPTVRSLANYLNKGDRGQMRVESGFQRATKQREALRQQRGRLQSIARERSSLLRQMDEATDSELIGQLDKSNSRMNPHRSDKVPASSPKVQDRNGRRADG